MACCFAIDKQESLAIIQSIIDSTPVEDPDGWEGIPLYKHKLGVTAIEANVTSNLPRIEDYYNEIIEESNKYTINRYEDDVGFDLQHISINTNSGKECISMETYLNIAECDWSYPSFIYDETLCSWIIKDDFWNLPTGISNDGGVIFLNFNYYKNNIDCEKKSYFED